MQLIAEHLSTECATNSLLGLFIVPTWCRWKTIHIKVQNTKYGDRTWRMNICSFSKMGSTSVFSYVNTLFPRRGHIFCDALDLYISSHLNRRLGKGAPHFSKCLSSLKTPRHLQTWLKVLKGIVGAVRPILQHATLCEKHVLRYELERVVSIGWEIHKNRSALVIFRHVLLKINVDANLWCKTL